MATKPREFPPDPEVERLDELIRDNVMRHIWEQRDGLRIHTDGVVLLCSCGTPVMVLRDEDVSTVLTYEPLGLKQARAAHSRHVAIKLGEALWHAGAKLIPKEG